MKIIGKKLKIDAFNIFEHENKASCDLLLSENGIEFSFSFLKEDFSDIFYETIWNICFNGLEFEEIDFENETVRLF